MFLWLVSLSCALLGITAAQEVESPLEGLKIEVMKSADPNKCELKSMKGDFVEVHFLTKIDESSATGVANELIDNSRDADGMNDPMSFQLGSDQMIEGIDQGSRGMCEGEVRRITIPPKYGYGDRGYSDKNSEGKEFSIPAGATLSAEVELMKIVRLQKQTTFKPKSCEQKAEVGHNIKVHYTLWIHPTSIGGEKGSMVESSRDDNNPMSLQLGGGRVIRAWDQGLVGMCVGEKMELVAPPEFAYGEKGQGDKIPPMATLQFEVELLETEEPNMFQQMDTNSDGKIDLGELEVFMKDKIEPGAVKQIFESEDKNQDGFIDWDEAPFPKGERPADHKKDEL